MHVPAHGVYELSYELAGKTLLHFAALGRRTSVARYLIQNGASVTAQDAAGCTPLHCLLAEAGSVSPWRLLRPAQQWKSLWRTDRFLHIRAPPPLAREAWLPALRMPNNAGELPFWAHRLEHVAWAHWRVAAAMVVAPDAFECSSRPGGQCGPLRSAPGVARPCLSDLPLDLRLRVLERGGIVGRSSDAERRRRRQWPRAERFDSGLPLAFDDADLHPASPSSTNGWSTGFEASSDEES